MAFGDFTVDRNSTKYVLGSGGTIISYATDQPAFEFNDDGSYKGLLVEPAATNIALQSEDFSTTWATGGDVTVTTNDTTAPDGTATADKLEITATGGDIVQVITTSATTYTFSVWLKEGNTTYTDISIIDSGTVNNRIRITWATGAVSVVGGSPIATKINELSSGWFRISVTYTFPAGSAGDVITIYPAGESLGSSGDYVYAWGAQFETSPIATSYIPTTTASVTRNKDDITLGSASSLIGQTEGTLYVEVDWKTASGTDQYLLNVNNGTSSNRMLIYNTGAGDLAMLAVANGVTLVNQGVSSSAYSGIQKIAFAYADSDFELYRNGSSIDSVSSGSLAALATLTQIDLGQRVNEIQQANMHIRAAALFTRRLTDAEAQALTTL